MKHLAHRRLVAVAAAGLLSLGALAACGSTSDSSGANDQSVDEQVDEILNTYTCDDLTEQVDQAAPDATTPISEFDEDKLITLYTWMHLNGEFFEDKDLGKNVTTAGELGYDYWYGEKNGNELSDSKHKDFEDASTAIDTSCPGIGFGFES